MTPGGALDGLRVLDLTHYLAGPYCTMLLAQQGAEVIKVERPGGGDPARRLGPFPDDRPDPERSGQFLYLNAHKLGITLNLQTAAGADLLRRLVRDTDVLVENFRPGTLDRLGLGHADLLRSNPALITCSISNFGQSGPYRGFAAEELVMQAMGGFVYACGDPNREPIGIPFPIAQYIAGVHGYIAILAQDAAGTPEHLDVSIMETFLAPQEPALTQYVYSGVFPQRVGRRRKNLYPGRILPCQDGYVAVLIVTAAEWKNLAGLIDRPDIVDDPRFNTWQRRLEHADLIDALLTEWFMARTAREVYTQAQRAKVPFAMVATARHLLESEHLAARKYFHDVLDSTGAHWQVPGPPFALSDCPTPSVGQAPRLGEHNALVLGERLGLSRTDLVTLTATGVV
jgi:CoA:oxalate CoA-transferase